MCALPWPQQHVSATCNCDHGTMLLAGCSDRRITAWATSSIFSRSPGPGALEMDTVTTVTEFDTSVRRVEDSEEETLNVLLFTKHSYMPSCRFCQMWHASCPGIFKILPACHTSAMVRLGLQQLAEWPTKRRISGHSLWDANSLSSSKTIDTHLSEVPTGCL